SGLVTKGEFGGACGRGVVAKMDRPWHQAFHFGLNIVSSPGFLNFVGRANLIFPAPHFERSSYTEPADSFGLIVIQLLNNLGDSGTYKSFEFIGRRISVI